MKQRRGKGVPCSIEGCVKLDFSRGWCKRHYNRYLEHGDPEWHPPARPCSQCGESFTPLDIAGYGMVTLCSEPCRIASDRATELRRVKNPDQNRALKVKSYFGISLDDYESRMAGAVCAICGECRPTRGKGGMVLDHCHDSKQIREPLCTPCNTGLGMFRDNPELMRAAADYVEKHAAAHLELVA